MIAAVGTDILATERIERALTSPAFIRFTFTAREIAEAAARSSPVLYFSCLFAAKEAVFKTLHMHGDDLKHWNCIEILAADSPEPQVYLYRKAAEAAHRRNLVITYLSLCCRHEYVQAFAVAEGDANHVCY